MTPGDIAKAVDRCAEDVELAEAHRERVIREAKRLGVEMLLPVEWLS